MEAADKVSSVCNIQLHMNGGDGEYSYANNSLLQKKIFLQTKPMLQESMVELCTRNLPECITFVDMGCSSGPNTFLPTWEILETIDQVCQKLDKRPPMLQVFLNDLPQNDFNSIFRLLPSFQKKFQEEFGGRVEHCSVAIMPGNFYGRLFPPHSLHFVHSSCSLHWLSEAPNVPMNKRQVYIAKASPPKVHQVYFSQFENDFTLFLKSRAEEVVLGGMMVLSFYGGEENNYSYKTYTPTIWDLFGMLLNDMVLEEIIEESKLDSFNFPFYGASVEEVKHVIQKEGSFKINRIETFQTGWDASINDKLRETMDNSFKGKLVVKSMRAIFEPILAAHFGENTIDVFFERLSKKIGDYLESFISNYILLSVTKG